MNEAQEKTRYTKTLDIVHELEKEFEVLGNAYSMQEKAFEKLQAEHETQAGHLKRLQKDLELRSNTEYRNKTTRQLAQEAFNQSTVTANWEGLGKHPVIEDIFEQIKTRSSNEGRRADDVLSKLENQMSVEEFFDQLSKSDAIREINNGIRTFDSNLAELKDVQEVDRHNIYEKFGLQRDKVADIEHAMNALEFIQDETIITLDGFGMFTIGAFAGLGYSPVANGLREILEKPKVAKDDGKKTSETPESS